MRTTAAERVLIGLVIALTGVHGAIADAAPPLVDGSLVLVIAVIVLALIGWFLIRGAFGLGGKDDGDDDSAGVGPLEGIDEDDDDRKKKKR